MHKYKEMKNKMEVLFDLVMFIRQWLAISAIMPVQSTDAITYSKESQFCKDLFCSLSELIYETKASVAGYTFTSCTSSTFCSIGAKIFCSHLRVHLGVHLHIRLSDVWLVEPLFNLALALRQIIVRPKKTAVPRFCHVRPK